MRRSHVLSRTTAAVSLTGTTAAEADATSPSRLRLDPSMCLGLFQGLAVYLWLGVPQGPERPSFQASASKDLVRRFAHRAHHVEFSDRT